MNREDYLFKDAPVLKAILKLALPTIFGQIIVVIYNMADTFYIGLTNSEVFLTAIGVCFPAFMFLSAISNLFGVGGASLIARSLGRQNKEKAKNVSSFSIIFCLITTLIYCLFVFIFKDVFINLLGGANSEVHYYALKYLNVAVVLGGVFTSLSMLFAHLLRAEGKSLDASIGIVLGGVLNIVLDPLFMFVILSEGNEVLGIAIATCLSNVISCIYYIIIIKFKYKNSTYIDISFRKDMLTDDIPIDVISVGLPACIMTTFENISYSVLENLMSVHGIMHQAGLGVAKKIIMLSHNCVRGLTQGVLSLLAYNYSAKNYERMNKVLNTTLIIAVSFSCLWVLTSVIFSNGLVSIFIHTEDVSKLYAIKFLRILCIGDPLSACAYTFVSYFQAVGRGKISFVLALLRKGAVDIPLMYLLAKLIPIYGEVIATPVTDLICCTVAVIVFKKFKEINNI